MAIGDTFSSTSGTKGTWAEDREHQPSLYAKRTIDIPSDLQCQYDYGARTDGQPIYIGYAPRGLANASAGWLLHAFTYDGSNNVTLRQTAYDSWTNRATASYA